MKKIDVEINTLQDNMDLVKQYLIEKKVNREYVTRSMLSLEDIVSTLINNSPDKKASIKLYSFMGNETIKIKAKGEKISLSEIINLYSDGDDEEYNAIVHQLMNRILGDNISVTYTKGANICTISVSKSKYANIINALLALVLGVAFGFILKEFTPDVVSTFIANNIFNSISTMFMSGIKMVVGPLVFFSMAVSIAGFSDLSALGRIAGKIIGGYLCTSAIAIGIGCLVFKLFPIGDPSLAATMSDAAAATVSAGSNASVSIIDTIVNIVPSTFVGPFVENNMLQIIFMGIMLGIAVGAVSKKYSFVLEHLNSLDAIFSKITSIIIGFLPAAIFCSMGKLIIDMDVENLISVILWLPVNYIGFLLMIIVYCLIILVVGRLNPIKFIKGYSNAMLTAFSTNSSNATMPTSMECCDKNLGIDKKIYSFSIPLGATINMDGCCINLVITTLFMAKIFGVSITGNELFSLFMMIMLLSVGAPGVPGGNLVCLVMILPQFGMPAEAISIIMGISTLSDMLLTTVNVTGDAMISTIVAKSENLLDLDTFNGKKN